MLRTNGLFMSCRGVIIVSSDGKKRGSAFTSILSIFCHLMAYFFSHCISERNTVTEDSLFHRFGTASGCGGHFRVAVDRLVEKIIVKSIGIDMILALY